jgi:hypothetical protein
MPRSSTTDARCSISNCSTRAHMVQALPGNPLARNHRRSSHRTAYARPAAAGSRPGQDRAGASRASTAAAEAGGVYRCSNVLFHHRLPVVALVTRACIPAVPAASLGAHHRFLGASRRMSANALERSSPWRRSPALSNQSRWRRVRPRVLVARARMPAAYRRVHTRPNTTPATAKTTVRTRYGPRVLASLCNLAIGALRLAGRRDITEATRWACRHMTRPFAILGFTS